MKTVVQTTKTADGTHLANGCTLNNVCNSFVLCTLNLSLQQLTKMTWMTEDPHVGFFFFHVRVHI